jgi:hypothetical protein
MINKNKFPLYGYICSIIALLFFIAHLLYLVDLCPYGISTVIRISFIQVILAILAIYFGCCSESKKAKTSIILGAIIIILVILYSILVVLPCISS